jgi:hypothetical protein
MTGKLTIRERELYAAATVIAKLTGVTLTKMRYGGRCESNCYARALVYFVGHEYIGASYPQVGRFLSKDHTTVIKGAYGILRRIPQDQVLVSHLHHIREKLGMSRQTITTITCSRCKTTESEGATGIDAYVIREVDGSPKLETLRGRRGHIMTDLKVRAEDYTPDSVLREHVAADLCDKCVKVINESLHFNIVDQDRNIIREDSEHFTG